MFKRKYQSCSMMKNSFHGYKLYRRGLKEVYENEGIEENLLVNTIKNLI